MYEAIALALVVLVLRTIDVSLGTLKTIFIVERRNLLAPSLGFIEATIFVIAASIVFQDLGNPVTIIGFGLGFALGTANGMFWARRLGLGSVMIRLFQSGASDHLIDTLRGAGYRLTSMQGAGRDGPVTMIQLILRKRNVPGALEIARPWLGSCFVTVGDEPVVASTPNAIIEGVRNLIQAPASVFKAAQTRAAQARAAAANPSPATAWPTLQEQTADLAAADAAESQDELLARPTPHAYFETAWQPL